MPTPGAAFAVKSASSLARKVDPMAENDITPSEEPTAPLPPLAENSQPGVAPVFAEPYAETPVEPSVEPPVAAAMPAVHPRLSTPAIFACIAAGAVALLLAFAAGWASHGMATRMALGGYGPGGGRMQAYSLGSPGGIRGHMGGRFGAGRPGSGRGGWERFSGQGGGSWGNGPMMRGQQGQNSYGAPAPGGQLPQSHPGPSAYPTPY